MIKKMVYVVDESDAETVSKLFSNALLFLVLLSGGYLIFIGDTPNFHYRASVKELESICDDSDQQSVEETRGKL